MKYIVLFAVFAIAAAVDYYKVNEDIDIDAIISNPVTLQSYVDCFMDKGPCSDIGLSYKGLIPESVEQACARCTDKMKYLYNRFLTGVKEVIPEKFDVYLDHVDPENKYRDALFKEISKFSKPTK